MRFTHKTLFSLGILLSKQTFKHTCISDIRHLGTYADISTATEKNNSATLELRHKFVPLSDHVPIYCFPGISLVLDYIFSDEIENFSRVYAVASQNSRQQLRKLIEDQPLRIVSLITRTALYLVSKET